MRKYAMIRDEKTMACMVGTGSDVNTYKRLGMTEMDVEEGPDGNWYLAGYAPAGPTEAELLEQAKSEKAAEFDTAMAGVDQALVRPLSDLLDAMLTPASMADDTEPGADALAASRAKFLQLRELQIRNRKLRAKMLEAATVEAVRAFAPVTGENYERDLGNLTPQK